MIPKTLRSFMFRLRPATENGEIKWIKEENRVFSCSHNRYSLFLQYYWNDEREESSYSFRIRRSGDDATFVVTDKEEDFDFMRTLDDAVEVNASNLDNIEDDFFGAGQKAGR